MLQTETRRIVRLLAIAGLGACCVVVVAFALTRGGRCRCMEARVPRGYRDGDGHFAGGVPGRAHHLPCVGSMAIVAQPSAHAADASSRDVGSRHRALRRQDGHPYSEPDDAAQARDRRYTPRISPVSPCELPEELHGLLEHAILASKRDPFDPMERALHEAGDRLDQGHGAPASKLVSGARVSADARPPGRESRMARAGVATTSSSCPPKAAPEAIADLCHLAPEQRGLRSLGRYSVSPLRGFAFLAWHAA